MEIIITGSAFNTGISIKNHIIEKLNNMSKKLNSNNVHKVHLVLNKDGMNFLSRLDIVKEVGQKPILHSSAEAVDPYHCVDTSIKKIEDQILKYKNKEMSKSKHDGMITKELSHHSDDLEIVDAIYEIIEQIIQNKQNKIMEIKFKKISPLAEMPTYQTDGSAGADLYACIKDDIILQPSSIKIIPTGIILDLPNGFEAQVRPRSGLALKHGITIPNSPGTVDSDYRGELCVILQNLGTEDFVIKNKMRIAQVVICPVNQFKFVECEDLSQTSRGEKGFGSTGLH